jgi:hypothetical protein
MPTEKDLKRLVRARMKKTGESYTAARAQLLKKKEYARSDYAEIAGMSDASVKEATGCTWERWVSTLDRAGAMQKSHGEIAKIVAFFKTDIRRGRHACLRRVRHRGDAQTLAR